MPTTWTSEKFCTAARRTLRPMRPNPLMPILSAMGCSEVENRNPSRYLRSCRNAQLIRPCTSTSQHGSYGLGHVLRREAEVLEQFICRRRLAVRIDADDGG